MNKPSAVLNTYIPVFTFSLYDLPVVERMLVHAIKECDMRQVLYWVHELVISGFTRRCLDVLEKLRTIHTICPPSCIYSDAVNVMFHSVHGKRKLKIIVKPETIASLFPMHNTSTEQFTYKWMMNNAIYHGYGVLPNYQSPITYTHIRDWVWFCEQTPVWRRRLEQHYYDFEKHVFATDDAECDFYETYDLEPGEQMMEIHKFYHGIIEEELAT